MNPEDVVVPTVLPLGDFKPVMCCICGNLLRKGRHVYREGTICNACHWSRPATVLRAAREYEIEKGGAG